MGARDFARVGFAFRTIASVALPALMIAACGGRISTADDQSSSSSSSSSGSASVGTGGTPTSSPTTTARPPVPAPTTTTKPPSPTGKVTYSAHAWPGGYDHLQIFKADFQTDRCIELHLVSPSSSSNPGSPFASVTAPSTWALQSAGRSIGASACGTTAPKKTISSARDGKGTVNWIDSLNVFPCKVDVHAAVIFDDAPEVESFEADQVSVDGC